MMIVAEKIQMWHAQNNQKLQCHTTSPGVKGLNSKKFAMQKIADEDSVPKF